MAEIPMRDDWCNVMACGLWLEGNECFIGKSIPFPDGDSDDCDEFEIP